MAERAPDVPIDLDAESSDQRDARLAWERERLDEAFDDVAAGRVITGQGALDWLDRWTAGEQMDEPPTAE